MITNASWLEMAPENLVQNLRTEAMELAKSADGEMVLDLATITRLDAAGARAMEELADVADGRAVRIVLRNVNVTIYKALKLLRIVRRFTFVS